MFSLLFLTTIVCLFLVRANALDENTTLLSISLNGNLTTDEAVILEEDEQYTFEAVGNDTLLALLDLPRWNWFLDGQLVMNMSSTYTIKATFDDFHTSILECRLTHDVPGGNISGSATGNTTANNTVPVTVLSKRKLTIYYGPHIELFENDQHLIFGMNETLSIELFYDTNVPSANLNISWIHLNATGNNTGNVSDGWLMHIPSLRLEHAGNYTVSVKTNLPNWKTKDSRNFSVRVLVLPRVTISVDADKVQCSLFPGTSEDIAYDMKSIQHKIGDVVVRSLKFREETNGNATVYVADVDRTEYQDGGMYACHMSYGQRGAMTSSNNKPFMGTSTASAEIITHSGPLTVDTPEGNKFNVWNGGKIALMFYSVPKYTSCTWKRPDNTVTKCATVHEAWARMNYYDKEVVRNAYEAVLSDVTANGTYTLEVKNEFGKTDLGVSVKVSQVLPPEALQPPPAITGAAAAGVSVGMLVMSVLVVLAYYVIMVKVLKKGPAGQMPESNAVGADAQTKTTPIQESEPAPKAVDGDCPSSEASKKGFFPSIKRSLSKKTRPKPTEAPEDTERHN